MVMYLPDSLSHGLSLTRMVTLHFTWYARWHRWMRSSVNWPLMTLGCNCKFLHFISILWCELHSHGATCLQLPSFLLICWIYCHRYYLNAGYGGYGAFALIFIIQARIGYSLISNRSRGSVISSIHGAITGLPMRFPLANCIHLDYRSIWTLIDSASCTSCATMCIMYFNK